MKWKDFIHLVLLGVLMGVSYFLKNKKNHIIQYHITRYGLL